MCRPSSEGGRRCPAHANKEMVNAKRRVSRNAAKAAAHRAAGDTDAAAESERLADLARAEVTDLVNMDTITADQDDVTEPDQPTAPDDGQAARPELTEEELAAQAAFEEEVTQAEASEWAEQSSTPEMTECIDRVTTRRRAVTQAEQDLAAAQARQRAAEASGDRAAAREAESEALAAGVEVRDAKQQLDVARIMAQRQADTDQQAAKAATKRAKAEAAEQARYAKARRELARQQAKNTRPKKR